MKKKSILMRVGVVAAALTLATTGMTSGTLAKYTASLNGEASAIIAKWDPHVYLGDGQTQDSTTEIALGDTVQPLETTFGDSGANHEAVNDGTKQYVMPGMKGEVPVFLTAGESDMDIKYTVMIYNWDEASTDQKYSNPNNLIFYTEPGQYKGLPPNAGGVLVGEGYLAGKATKEKYKTNTAVLNKLSSDKKLNITWEWPYEYDSTKVLTENAATVNSKDTYDAVDNDDMDTNEIGGKNMGFTVKITFTQATGVGNDSAAAAAGAGAGA